MRIANQQKAATGGRERRHLVTILDAGVSELWRAFSQHTGMGEQSKYLLLFYAVECGLKAAYLRSRSFHRISQIRDEKLRKTHDLQLLAKELRLPAALIGDLSFRLRRDRSRRWLIDKAHEAWRYGVTIDSEDHLTEQLQRLQQWLKENR